MEHLFSIWDNIISQINSAKQIMLLCDFDGTLAPIVESPELANISEESSHLLKALAHKHRFNLGIISGRAVSDLRSKVNIEGIIYAGNHGLEIEWPGFNFRYPLSEEIKLTLKILNQVLRKTLNTIKGSRVEDKGMTISVHYRLVNDIHKENEVKNIFERTVGLARSLGKVKTTSGKKVYEVRPPIKWNKGEAIQLLIRNYFKRDSRNGILPIYLGDDLTDEDAFKVVRKCGGITIYVGDESSNSAAQYYLKTTGEVNEFMQKLVKLDQQTL